MVSLLSSFLSFVFLFIAGIHIYWGFGGEWGKDAVLPKIETSDRPLFIPGLAATLMVAVVFIIGVFLVQSFVSNITLPIPSSILYYGMIFQGTVFFLRSIGEFRYVGFFKTQKGTLFSYWDDRLFSPLCLTVSLFSFALIYLK